MSPEILAVILEGIALVVAMIIIAALVIKHKRRNKSEQQVSSQEKHDPILMTLASPQISEDLVGSSSGTCRLTIQQSQSLTDEDSCDEELDLESCIRTPTRPRSDAYSSVNLEEYTLQAIEDPQHDHRGSSFLTKYSSLLSALSEYSRARPHELVKEEHSQEEQPED